MRSFGVAVAALCFATLALAHDEGGGVIIPDPPDPGDGTQPPGPPPPESPRARKTDIVLLGHADPQDVDGWGHVGGFNADVYTHDGHAYLASWGRLHELLDANEEIVGYDDEFCPSKGVRAYDISDPTDPLRVSTFGDDAGEPDLDGTWTEKVIVQAVQTEHFDGALAVVSFQNCMPEDEVFRGFGLYDVTDPANPVRLSVQRTSHRGSHEIWLQPVGDRVYVWAAVMFSEHGEHDDDHAPGPPDFQIWDATDPTAPVLVGTWGALADLGIDPHEGEGVQLVTGAHSARGEPGGTTAWVSYLDLGTVILDVSDPSEPVYLGRTVLPGDHEGNIHSADVDGDLLIETSEDVFPRPRPDLGLEGSWGHPRFYDVSDPSEPVLLSDFRLPTTTQFPAPGPGLFTVHDPDVKGDLAFFAWFSEGLVVADIKNPKKPKLLGQFLPPPKEDPSGLNFPGEETVLVWGVDLGSDVIAISDINSGLWLLRLEEKH